ncbi:MAG: aspartate-semialdehyde dehydrogenase, partial [Opitutales bacterium]
MKKPKLGIVGATGAVGQEILSLLSQREFPYKQIKALASHRSVGRELPFGDAVLTVEEARPEVFDQLDLAIFSAGGDTSRELAPVAASRGCVVVDNSSAFRMDRTTPLVVPEINP